MENKKITVMFGDKTARERVILTAHDWQMEHKEENSPVPTEEYAIISSLLGLIPYEELNSCLLKWRIDK